MFSHDQCNQAAALRLYKEAVTLFRRRDPGSVPCMPWWSPLGMAIIRLWWLTCRVRHRGR